MTEDHIHQSIVTYLRWALPGAIIHHSRNSGNRGGKKGIIDGVRGKRMGVHRGFPDLIVFYNHRVMFIEVKAPRGYVSSSQKETRAHLRDHGFGHYCIAKSVDDVKDFLAEVEAQLVEIPMRGVIE